jgi:RNA-binding protein
MTGKQRAYLRGMANSYDTIFQIGKENIGENLIRQVRDALEARELIKLRVLNNSELTADEAADKIADAVNAEVIQVIGTRFILYKESEKHKKIELI